jgi:hypothetical protein
MKDFPEIGDVISLPGSSDKHVVVETDYIDNDLLDVIKWVKIQKLSPGGEYLPDSPQTDVRLVVYDDSFIREPSDEEKALMTPEDLVERQSFLKQDKEDLERRQNEGASNGDFTLEAVTFHGHMSRIFVW